MYFFSKSWLVTALFLFIATSPLFSEELATEKSWLNDEITYTRGMIHNLSELIEKPRYNYNFRDNDGRQFTLGKNEQIKHHLNSQTWRPSLPDATQAHLLLSEAEALSKRGAHSEALFIWKSLRSMSREKKQSRRLTSLGARATRKINQLKNENSKFILFDHQSEPYAFYNLTGQTQIRSDSTGFSFLLPERWRFSNDSQDDLNLNKRIKEAIGKTVYLKREELALKVTINPRPVSITTRHAPGNYIQYLDHLRGLTPNRKDILNYDRRRHPLHATYCDGQLCALLQSSLRYRQVSQVDPLIQSFEFGLPIRPAPVIEKQIFIIEYYRLTATNGIHLEMRCDPQQSVQAETVMRFLLDNFSSTRE